MHLRANSLIEKGDLIPYYRILRSYYRKELDKISKDCGFEIISADRIVMSKEGLLRAKARFQNRSSIRLRIPSNYVEFPASIDVIARPI